MTRPRSMSALVALSAGMHAVALALFVAFAGSVAVRASPRRAQVEIDFATVSPARREAAPLPGRSPITPTPSPSPTRAAAAMRSARVLPAAQRGRAVVQEPPVRVPEPIVPPPTVLAAPRPVINVASLLTSARGEIAHFDVPSATHAVDAPRSAAPDRETQARSAAGGYVAELLASNNAMEPSQLHAYYNALSRRMRETWRPGFYRTPTMVDALLAAPRMMGDMGRQYRDRASTFATTGRPDDPARPFIPTDFEDRRGFSTRTTSTIVEVEQNDEGVVLSVRVVRSARIRDFDNAAVEAVRAAIPQQGAVRVPGGRRSRWEFDVVASRDVILPIAGFTFNESNGFFEMNYPGAMHIRTRVRPVGSRALGVNWPLPRSQFE